jgi:hypothetical protein
MRKTNIYKILVGKLFAKNALEKFKKRDGRIILNWIVGK